MPVITKNMVFTYDTLNIFTDASVNADISCPGFIAYLGDTEVGRTVKFLENSTNNEGEVYAVKMALIFASYMSLNVNIRKINIFSDSLITVKGLTEWMKNWIKNAKSDTIYSSSGNPVANQSIFLDCVKLIIYYNMSVNIYHVSGHTDPTNDKSKQCFIRDFYNFNKGLILSPTLRDTLMICNNNIDEFTRQSLKNVRMVECINCKKDSLFTSIYNENIDFDKYFKLIGEE